ncbi:MAG: glycosyl transferase [Clostridiaceae bacterium]|jgi:hypothetical protein|nr:glycosyl transferase [Clostridiaceae bacterium]
MDQLSIPNIIHYCWFGGKPKPQKVLDYISTWKKFAPKFEFKEWNEETFPISRLNRYARQAYDAGKFAFVTDYVRLKVLYSEGGIYFDTDVEMIQPFSDLILQHGFIGLEEKFTVCSAVIGVPIREAWVKELLDVYDKRNFLIEDEKMDMTPNSSTIYNYLIDKYGGLEMENNDCIHLSSSLSIYSKEYFSPKDFVSGKIHCTNKTFTIHHFEGTWKSRKEIFIGRISTFLKRILGVKVHNKLKVVLHH